MLTDILYSRDGLMRLIEAQRWQLALTFVGHDPTLQKVLLKHMVAAEELVHADQLVKKMVAGGVEADILHILQSHQEAGKSEYPSQHDLEDGEYLALTVADDNIVFCDVEDAVRDAMHYFSGLTSINLLCKLKKNSIPQ